MKYLLSKENTRRLNFKNIETQYRALKFIVHNQNFLSSWRWQASLLLSKFLKQHSSVLLKNRCFLTGRGRGYSRFFNLSRIQIRNLARNNEISFVTKSSW